jgi:hypothetical protein
MSNTIESVASGFGSFLKLILLFDLFIEFAGYNNSTIYGEKP